MDFDPGRSPAAARAALRYVEDLVLRARFALRGSQVRHNPVDILVLTHRRIHRDGDAAAIRRAFEVADLMHTGQNRISGEPFITHPLAVAQIVAELGMDTTTIVAALLHDTVEDTSYTMGALRTDFGGEVGLLVDGVTKFEKVSYGDAAEAETIRKMLLRADTDVRVLVIKLADRLHNMRTIDARSLASRSRIARATSDVLIPLCDRLGVQYLKRELEDSVLAALEPQAHAMIQGYVAHRPEFTSYVDRMVRAASSVVRAYGVRARVIARPHHLYSIWKDTYDPGRGVLYELPRIAIVVSGAENDCYAALGAIHTTWRPLTGRFKDFIASPKNNLYRSLHTTVIGPDGRAVEVLIRTETMDRNAEYGITAPYRFARRGPGAHSARGRDRAAAGVAGHEGEHLGWLTRLVEWQAEAVDPVRFLESLRCDLSEGQVRVFADGQRHLLPAGATPIDVAYAIGPEVGNRCIAATVNGQLAFLNSPLADGDVVEIHTVGPHETRDPDGKPIGPSKEWLTFVRTPLAQLQIEHQLGLTHPEESRPVFFAARVLIGRRGIAMELRRHGRTLADAMPLLMLAESLGLTDVESLMVAVADHRIAAADVAQRLIEQVDGSALEAASAAHAADTTNDVPVETPTGDSATMTEAAIGALPTNTPTPQPTNTPTAIPQPTNTPKPPLSANIPTAIPQPTNTPKPPLSANIPTATPQPTDVPASPPPTIPASTRPTSASVAPATPTGTP